MRYAILFSLLVCIACNNDQPQRTITPVDTLKTTPKEAPATKDTKPENAIQKTYSNKRFKDVTVERIAEDKFKVQGLGQIFEASFNWIIEDGHDELQKGFQMTDAGAPEWGKFEFTITARKERENSTLTLILFETSAEDGSRQHELPIALY